MEERVGYLVLVLIRVMRSSKELARARWARPGCAEADIDPNRVKFKRTFRTTRRRAADIAVFPPDQQERIRMKIISDVTTKKSLNTKRRHRTYPQVVNGPPHLHWVKRPGDTGTRHIRSATIKLVNLRSHGLAA